MTSTMMDITPEASSRICAHMNDDHAHTCHAMVVSAISNGGGENGKVQNARMTSVSTTAYSLSYVLCNGDACSMREIVIPFVPRLNSPDEVGPRLIRDHHRAMTPKFAWLVTDPIIRTIAAACILLGAGTSMGRDGLGSTVDGIPWVKSMIDATFGSSSRFADAVAGAWYFALVAHSMEAIYTAYVCRVILKLKMGATMKWFVLNSCVGYPVMKKVLELVAIDSAARSKKRG
ncbi:hypothetical protein ACHAXA_000726 [Cyclostephanos tholiformis]|uniref:DUF2470 domain-containing protein n=1 Tax=Cyclostephanos tholiformis TaxID=382380 RepID=A0ABD3RS39_9STRA